MATPTQPRWTIADALETYAIRQWGAGYFAISENSGGSASDKVQYPVRVAAT